MLHDKQRFINVPFQSTKDRKKELCADNIKTIGDVIVPHVETKSVFTFQPIKRLVPTTAKSAKPAATFWIFLLRTRNRHLCCLVMTVHIVYTSRDYEKPSPFLKKFLHQSQSPAPKKVEMSPNTEKNQSVSYWLMIWATYSFFKSFFFSILIYS